MSKISGNWSRLKFAPNGIRDRVAWGTSSVCKKTVGFLQVAGEKPWSTLLHRSNPLFSSWHIQTSVKISYHIQGFAIETFWYLHPSGLKMYLLTSRSSPKVATQKTRNRRGYIFVFLDLLWKSWRQFFGIIGSFLAASHGWEGIVAPNETTSVSQIISQTRLASWDTQMTMEIALKISNKIGRASTTGTSLTVTLQHYFAMLRNRFGRASGKGFPSSCTHVTMAIQGA